MMRCYLKQLKKSNCKRILDANGDQHAKEVNLNMADGNTLLSDKKLEVLVVLRVNRNFMVFMREKHFLEIKALQPPFNVAVVVPDIEEAEEGS